MIRYYVLSGHEGDPSLTLLDAEPTRQGYEEIQDQGDTVIQVDTEAETARIAEHNVTHPLGDVAEFFRQFPEALQ